MKTLGYYNGTVKEVDQMQIAMRDRSNFFGDGIYEVCVVKNGIIFAFADHIKRFYNNLAKVRISFDHNEEQLQNLLQELIKQVDGDTLTLYWHVSRGTAKRSHVFPDAQTPTNLLVMIEPVVLPDRNRALKLKTVEDIRSLRCDIKSLNLLPNVMAAQIAKENGCDEAILHRNGIVSECAHSNIFYLKDQVLYTAPLNHLILPGITRARLIALSKRMGITVVEDFFHLDDLLNADEIIVTSTTKQCMRVCEVDGKAVAQNDPTTFFAIQNAFFHEFDLETSGC